MRKIDDDNSPFVKYKLKIIATKFNNLNGCFCYDQLCLEVLFLLDRLFIPFPSFSHPDFVSLSSLVHSAPAVAIVVE